MREIRSRRECGAQRPNPPRAAVTIYIYISEPKTESVSIWSFFGYQYPVGEDTHLHMKWGNAERSQQVAIGVEDVFDIIVVVESTTNSILYIAPPGEPERTKPHRKRDPHT